MGSSMMGGDPMQGISKSFDALQQGNIAQAAGGLMESTMYSNPFTKALEKQLIPDDKKRQELIGGLGLGTAAVLGAPMLLGGGAAAGGAAGGAATTGATTAATTGATTGASTAATGGVKGFLSNPMNYGKMLAGADGFMPQQQQQKDMTNDYLNYQQQQQGMLRRYY